MMDGHMKFFGSCSKTIAAGFAIIFIISALSVLILFNLQSHYLDPETYKTVLDKQEVYDRLPAILAEQIAYSMTYNPCLENPEECVGEDPGDDENNGPPPYLKNLKTEDWERMFSIILTPEWTKSQSESILDQFFNFLDSDEQKVTIAISLIGLKENLIGQKGMEFIRIVIEAQPPCTETFLGLIINAAAGDFSPDQLLLCRPPERVLDGLTPTMEAALGLVVDDLPDQVVLRKKVFVEDGNASTSNSVYAPQKTLQTVRTLIQFSPILPLIFLVLIAFFAVRSLKDLLFWWGIPFMIVGLSVLGMGLFARPLMDWGLETFVLNRIQGTIDPSFLELIIDSIELLIQSYIRVIANQSALIAYLGIIMTGVGLLTIYKSEVRS
jgi:hypothetical protein